MPVAPAVLQNQANRFAQVLGDLEIALGNKIRVSHEPDADYPDTPDSVRVRIETFAPQLVWVTVGWLRDEVTPHYFVNWSSTTGDFACHEGTPSYARALFNLGCCIESAARFQLKQAQLNKGGRA